MAAVAVADVGARGAAKVGVPARLPQRLARHRQARPPDQPLGLRDPVARVAAAHVADRGKAPVEHLAEIARRPVRDIAGVQLLQRREVGGRRGDVHMGVDQPRHQRVARGVDHQLGGVGDGPLRHLGDAPVGDHHVHAPAQAVAHPVEQVGIVDADAHGVVLRLLATRACGNDRRAASRRTGLPLAAARAPVNGSGMSAAPLLDVTDLARSFYGVQALRGASFAVREGTITALIGPNGAGKTTAFNCISGVIPPESGTVRFRGADITGLRPEQISQRGLVRTFQIARGFPTLTVLETLLLHGDAQPGEAMAAALFSPGRARAREAELVARAREVAARLRLDHVLDNLSTQLSGGQKKLLEIGRALMGKPGLILLDEPVAGVNPTLAVEIAERIRELRDDGLTFLIVEHDMDIVARLCDPIIVMAEGATLMEGRFEDIVADTRVQDAYLGRRR